MAADATPVSLPPSPLVDFIAGTTAGVTSLLCGHPFDTVKVRMQAPARDPAHRYSTAWGTFAQIMREEKVKGLFKGVTSPMLGVAATNASVFTSYGLVLRLLQAPQTAASLSPSSDLASKPHQPPIPTLTQVALAGAGSGVLSSVVTTPIDRLKILQQSAPPGRPQPSLVELVRRQGVAGCYRGLTVTALRDLGYGPYFGTYELVCRAGLAPGEEAGAVQKLAAGGAAGITGWGSTFAVDVVKTRIQASEAYLPAPVLATAGGESLTMPREASPYRTIRSAVVHSYRDEGWGVFVRGLGPTLLRSVPVNMVCFATFEFVVAALS